MVVTNAIPPSTKQKTWADIVKGRSEGTVDRLRPAGRGTHLCVCTGEFLVMLGHYGWIMALQDIDHPDVDRHGGRIYLRAADLRPGSLPNQGDEVTFFLYADENGLGAEDCFATRDPHPPPPPRKHVCSRPKINRGIWAEQTKTKKPLSAAAKGLSAAAQEFVPTVLVSLNTENTMNPGAKKFVPAPPGLGPAFHAETTEFVLSLPLCKEKNTYCAINAKRFYDDDDSSDDGTESTASDFSGRVLVAPGLSTCFVSNGKPEHWSTLSSRCAQAVVDADMDSDSWCDEDDDGDDVFLPVPNRAEEWAAVSARCAQAVGKVDNNEHPWHMRNAAAAAKLRADVGDDIRWDIVLDALAELDGGQTSLGLPPGLSPPGLAPPGFVPGLVPPGLT